MSPKYSIDTIALFVSWCLVLWVFQFLSECFGGFELHWDVMFSEEFSYILFLFSSLLGCCFLEVFVKGNSG